MDNKNLTLKWIDTLGNNKIVFERGIIDCTKNRGIYGIFIIVNCPLCQGHFELV